MAVATGFSAVADAETHPTVSSADGPSLAAVNCGESQAQDSHCTDACQMGLCHIGHCSFISAAPVLVSDLLLQVENGLSSHSIIESPVLDGLRRPPRPA